MSQADGSDDVQSKGQPQSPSKVCYVRICDLQLVHRSYDVASDVASRQVMSSKKSQFHRLPRWPIPDPGLRRLLSVRGNVRACWWPFCWGMHFWSTHVQGTIAHISKTKVSIRFKVCKIVACTLGQWRDFSWLGRDILCKYLRLFT